MGSYYNVHFSGLQSLNGHLCPCRRTKSGKQVDTYRIVFHSLGKRIVMLLGQNRGRNQYDHLFPILHRFKSTADGNLRLAVSHIAADQTVHDLITFHILFHGFNGSKLIHGLLIRKNLFKFFLPYIILIKPETFLTLPGRIKGHQVPGNVLYRCPDFGFCAAPLLGSQFVYLWYFNGIGTCIFLNQIQSGSQNIEITVIRILDFNIVFRNFIDFYFFDSPVYSKSVVFMYYIVADI